MTIETKYNIGDEVWGIPNGEPVKLTIARIYIKIHKHKLSISYEFDDIDGDDKPTPRELDFPHQRRIIKELVSYVCSYKSLGALYSKRRNARNKLFSHKWYGTISGIYYT